MKLLLTPPFDSPIAPKILTPRQLRRILAEYGIKVVKHVDQADLELVGRSPFTTEPKPRLPKNRAIVIDGEPPQPEFTLPHYFDKEYVAVLTPATLDVYANDGMAFYIPPLKRRPVVAPKKFLCQMATYRKRPGNALNGMYWTGTTNGAAWGYRVLCNLRVKVGMALKTARPNDVDLFGNGWPSTANVSGANRGREFTDLIEARDNLVKNYAFDLDWENMEIPHYVSEKFWSTVRMGVLPVYWGPPEFHERLPTGTIVDARKYWTGTEYDVQGLFSELSMSQEEHRTRVEKLLDWYYALPRDSAYQSAIKMAHQLGRGLSYLAKANAA